MSSEIDAIRRYIETVPSSFAREIKDYNTYINEQAASAPGDIIQVLAEDLGEIQGFLGDHFPSFALETTFVATFALLEDEMLKIGLEVLDNVEALLNELIKLAQ